MMSARFLSLCYIFSLACSRSANKGPIYASIHNESLSSMRVPTPVDLQEVLMEHSLSVVKSRTSTLFTRFFCTRIEDCIEYVEITTVSSSPPIFVSTLNSKINKNNLPYVYAKYVPSLASIVAPPSPTIITADMTYNPQHVESNPYSSSRPNLSTSPLLQQIQQEQKENIQSFYLQQVSARLVNWCYINDFADLIYPFLPEKIVDDPQFMKKSICNSRIYRTMFQILRFARTRLSNAYALNLIFTFPLLIHLRETASYLDTAFNSLYQIAKKSKEANYIKAKKEEEEISASYELFLEDALDNSHSNVITDTILIACKAIQKVAYYFNQDPKGELFYVEPLQSEARVNWEQEWKNYLGTKELAEVIQLCQDVTPSILFSYETRESRRQYQQYYDERDSDKLSGRLTVFPELPMDIKTVRQLSQIANEEIICREKEEENPHSNKELLYCLGALSKKFSLMLGVIATNLNLITPEYTKKVLPILERLQAIQLVVIYFKHMDEEKTNNRSERAQGIPMGAQGSTMLQKEIEDESALNDIIHDVLSLITIFAKEIQQEFTGAVRDAIEYATPKTREFRKKMKAAQTLIMKLSLNDLYSYIAQKEEQKKVLLNTKKQNYYTKKGSQKSLTKTQVKNEENDEREGDGVRSVKKEEAISEDESLINEAGLRSNQREEQFDDLSFSNVMKELGMVVETNAVNEKKRREKYSDVLDNWTYNCFALENLSTKLLEIPLPSMIKKQSDRLSYIEQGPMTSMKCILNIYNSLEALYEWSLPTAFFLNRRYVPSTHYSMPTYDELTNIDFSFPGNSKGKPWMPWSVVYCGNLRNNVFNKVRWQSYFKLSNKDLIVSQVAWRVKSKIIREDENNKETKLSKGKQGEDKEYFAFLVFAIDILRSLSLLFVRKQIKSPSLITLLSNNANDLISLINAYKFVVVEPNPEAINTFIATREEKDKGGKSRKKKTLLNSSPHSDEIKKAESDYLPSPSVKDPFADETISNAFHSYPMPSNNNYSPLISSNLFGIQGYNTQGTNQFSNSLPVNHNSREPDYPSSIPDDGFLGQHHYTYAPSQNTLRFGSLHNSSVSPQPFFTPNKHVEMSPYHHHFTNAQNSSYLALQSAVPQPMNSGGNTINTIQNLETKNHLYFKSNQTLREDDAFTGMNAFAPSLPDVKYNNVKYKELANIIPSEINIKRRSPIIPLASDRAFFDSDFGAQSDESKEWKINYGFSFNSNTHYNYQNTAYTQDYNPTPTTSPAFPSVYQSTYPQSQDNWSNHFSHSSFSSYPTSYQTQQNHIVPKHPFQYN